MKTIYKIARTALLAAAVVAMTTSCKKWLEESSPSQNLLSDFFQNNQELQSALTGVYSALQPIYYNNSFGVTVLGTDETFTTRPTGVTEGLDLYNMSPQLDMISQYYTKHYDVIQRANVVINRAPGVPGLDTLGVTLEGALAEARFLRAWSYFDLVRTFGRVPLVLTETASKDDYSYYIRRDSIAKVYQAIIADLEYASGNLTKDPTRTRLSTTKNLGHVYYWAAKGLLARVYLTLGTSMLRRPQPIQEYSDMGNIWKPDSLLMKCRDICDQMTAQAITNGPAGSGMGLMGDYGDVFLVQNKNYNPESIWEIQFSATPGLGAAWSKQFGVAGIGPGSALSQSFNCATGTTAMKPVASFWRMFADNDVRRSWSLADWSVTFLQGFLTDPTYPDYTQQTQLQGLAINDGSPGNINLNLSPPNVDPANMDPATVDLWRRSCICNNTAVRFGISKYRWGNAGSAAVSQSDPMTYWHDNNMTYNQANTPNNVIVLRFADIILMRVEADIYINAGTPTQASVDLMNQTIVARSRGLDASGTNWKTAIDVPTIPDYTTATLTLAELQRQRACELCFELNRWFDLVRWGLLDKLVPARLCSMGGPTVMPYNYLMPIPQRELDMARDKANFSQNPGY